MLLVRQLALLLVLCIENEENLWKLIHEILEWLPKSPEPILEVLLALPGEIRDSSRRAHTKMLPHIVKHTDIVLERMAGMIKDVWITMHGGRLNHEASLSLMKRLCLVVGAWVDVPSIPGGTPEFPIQKLYKRYSEVFDLFLKILKADSTFDECAEAVSECFLSMLKATEPEEQYALDALQHLVSCVLESMSAIHTLEISRLVVVARLGSGIAECWPEGAAGRLQQATSLSMCMLTCLDRSDPTVVESVLEYFYALNLVHVKDRIGELGLPLHMRLTEKLGGLLMYPNDIEDCTDLSHDDDFIRLRHDVVPELLQESYMLLRNLYMEEISEIMQKGNSWQHVEIALYLINAVALQIRTRLIPFGDQVTEECTKGNQILCDIMQTAFASLRGLWQDTTQGNVSSVKNNALVLLGWQLCETVERFAVWFSKNAKSPFHEAFDVMMRILQVEDISQFASKAINALCVRCANRFSDDPSMVLSMVDSIQQTVAKVNILEGELDLVEGMSSVAASMKTGAQDCLVRIVTPYVNKLNELLGLRKESVTEKEYQTFVRMLSLLSCTLKALLPTALADNNSGGWTAIHLLQSLEQTLLRICQSPVWGNDQLVLEGVVEICKQGVCSGRDKSAKAMLMVMPIINLVFQTAIVPSALSVLSEMIEIQYKEDHVRMDIFNLTQASFQKAFQVLQQEGIAGKSALVSSLLEVGYAFMVYSPSSIIEMGSLEPFLDLATVALASREPEVVIHAIQLLEYVPAVCSPDDVISEHMAASISQIFLNKSPRILHASLICLCDSCPRQKMRSIANLIKAILIPAAEQGKEWFASALNSPEMALIAGDVLSDSDNKARMYQLVTSGRLRPQRLSALLMDIALIIKREEELDALISYEL